MGASVSTNTTTLITKAINTVTNDLVQSADVNNNQSIIFKVENVDGDVNISNVKTTQKINLSSKNMFQSLIKSENSNKINKEIEQITKSLISGLNLAQLSKSSNEVNSIIQNCIKIKNDSLEKCAVNTNQNYELIVESVNGNVNLKNINVDQASEIISECILKNNQDSNLINQTDLKIKNLSQSSAEGINLNFLSLFLIAGLGGVGIIGTSIKNFIGPLISIVGMYLCYVSYNKKKKDDAYEKNISTSPDFLNENKDTSKFFELIKEYKNISENDKVENYGEADVYELFEKTLKLYKYNDLENKKINEIIDNNKKNNNLNERIKTCEDFTINSNINICFLNSTKYIKAEINTGVENKNNEKRNIILTKRDNLKDYNTKNKIFFVLTDNVKNNYIEIEYYEDDKKIQSTTFYFPFTFYSIKTFNKFETMDLLKDKKFLIGGFLIILGVLLFVHFKKT